MFINANTSFSLVLQLALEGRIGEGLDIIQESMVVQNNRRRSANGGNPTACGILCFQKLR